MIDISTLGNNVFKSPCDADSFLIVLFAACVVVVQCHVMMRSHVPASSVHPQLSAKICHTKYRQHNAELQTHSKYFLKYGGWTSVHYSPRSDQLACAASLPCLPKLKVNKVSRLKVIRLFREWGWQFGIIPRTRVWTSTMTVYFSVHPVRRKLESVYLGHILRKLFLMLRVLTFIFQHWLKTSSSCQQLYCCLVYCRFISQLDKWLKF